jgi:uncharacterized Fe-S cluster-containing protein
MKLLLKEKKRELPYTYIFQLQEVRASVVFILIEHACFLMFIFGDAIQKGRLINWRVWGRQCHEFPDSHLLCFAISR